MIATGNLGGYRRQRRESDHRAIKFEVVLKAVEVDRYASRCVYDYFHIPKS